MEMRPEIIDFTDGIPVKAYVRGGCQYPYHWHDTLEILQVLKGSVHIGIGDDNFLLYENDIAIVNMGELHSIAKTDDDNEILLIQIEERFCRSVLPDNAFLYFYCCSAGHEVQAPEKYATVKEYIARLLRAIIEKSDEEHKRNFENILAAMLAYLSRNFDFLRWGYGTTPFDDKLVNRLRQIAEHASSNLDVQLRLKDLAAEAGVSMRHLSYAIKDKFGMTFLELLYYSRCAYAVKLLLSTNRRIIDIALECGFSDVKYFVKYFNKYFHVYPSTFRKLHRTDMQTLSSQTEYREYPLSRALSRGIP
ncbi:MAG: helix-turn-helix transcriptional regulator [Bacillota bacterium]